MDAGQSSDADERPLSLLWIDDSRSMRAMVRLAAGELARPLETAASVAEARTLLGAGTRFDWIVCDYHLGTGSSAEFVRELVARGHRVAVLTGRPDRVERSLGVRVFAKPMDLVRLVEELRAAL